MLFKYEIGVLPKVIAFLIFDFLFYRFIDGFRIFAIFMMPFLFRFDNDNLFDPLTFVFLCGDYLSEVVIFDNNGRKFGHIIGSG